MNELLGFLAQQISADAYAAMDGKTELTRDADRAPDSFGRYAGRFSPDRMIAECQAKSRMLELYQADPQNYRAFLEVVAAPYIGMPGWNEDWTPVVTLRPGVA